MKTVYDPEKNEMDKSRASTSSTTELCIVHLVEESGYIWLMVMLMLIYPSRQMLILIRQVIRAKWFCGPPTLFATIVGESICLRGACLTHAFWIWTLDSGHYHALSLPFWLG